MHIACKGQITTYNIAECKFAMTSTDLGTAARDANQTSSVIVARTPLTGGDSKCYGHPQEGYPQIGPLLHLLALLAAALTAQVGRVNQPEGQLQEVLLGLLPPAHHNCHSRYLCTDTAYHLVANRLCCAIRQACGILSSQEAQNCLLAGHQSQFNAELPPNRSHDLVPVPARHKACASYLVA